MDAKLLLTSAISLLYWNSQLDVKFGGSQELIKEVLPMIKVPEVTLDTDTGRETIKELRKTLIAMNSDPEDTVYDRETLLQRLRINIIDDDTLYNSIADGFKEGLDQDGIAKKYGSYYHGLKQDLRLNKFRGVIRNVDSMLYKHGDEIEFAPTVQQLMAELEELSAGAGQKNKSIVKTLSFSSRDSVSEMLIEGANRASLDGVLRWGFAGMSGDSGMMGDHFGIRRGETMVVGALQHSYKSGFMLDTLRHHAMYNTPFMFDEKRKPLLLFVSIENSLDDNLIILYMRLKAVLEGIVLKRHKLMEVIQKDEGARNEIADWVIAQLTKTGYHIEMVRADPGTLDYRGLFEIMADYESQGYEIHALYLDYLQKMSFNGCKQGAQGQEIRDLFSRVRNRCEISKTAFITPHQLSPDAKALKRQGVTDFVKQIANKGYWDSCKAIDQEVDIELIINKVVDGDDAYLEFQRGKHRKPSITPEKHLYFIQRFEGDLGLLDDIHMDTPVYKRSLREFQSQAMDNGLSGWF